jgi:uncharacterized repeat protein (TIGR01451 family)
MHSHKKNSLSRKLRQLLCLSGGFAVSYSLLAAIAPSKAWAGDLEFSLGSYPSPPNGPALSAGPATLLENTLGSTFVPYTPATTINISISNQQYPGGLQLGTTGTASPVFNKLNFYGGPTDAMFTSNPNGTAGTGVVGNDNYAYQLYASVQPLVGLPNNARYYYGDVTLTFNHPVSDPVIHMSGMGGNSTLTGTTPHGHSAEMELITPGITASKLSGSNFLNVTGNKMLNSATTITASCATGAACGSVKFAGTNITTLTFKMYVRGDAGTAPWSGGDVFLFGGTSVAKPITVSGTVFNDANGLTDSLINGTGTNAGGLFANLVDLNGKVVASTAVAANGTYSFPGIGAGQYTVSLSTTAGIQGSIAPATNLPATWSNTGEGTAATGDGLVDGKTSLTVAAVNLSGVNFGIQQQLVNQPPDTTPLNSPSQTNPGGTATVQVPTLAGTDPEDGPLGLGKSFKIVSLPTNGTLSYNNSPVLAGQIISNYDPTLLKLDPNDGAITVSFTYAAIDSTNQQDPTPATVTMPFSVAAITTCPIGSIGTGSGYATGGLGQYLTKNAIYWLDWTCGGTSQFTPGSTVTKSWAAPNGIVVTATVSNITKTIRPYNTGSWGGDRLDDLYSGVNPIGLLNAVDGEDPTYTINFSMTLNGVPIQSDIVAAEAEDTGGPNESVSWTTDGNPWEVLEAAPNSLITAAFTNANQTLSIQPVPNAGGGTLLALTQNVSNINVNMKAGGQEAIAFGIMVPFDYGDAPASYGSAPHFVRRDASGGAKPTIATSVNSLTMATLGYSTPYLGAIGADPESIPHPTVNADGDKLNGENDEDAWTTLPSIPSSGNYALNNIPVHNTTGSAATLYAWIDFNKNGVFEADEFSSTAIADNATTADLSWVIPTGTTTGPTYARFRVTTQALVDDTATTTIDERSTETAINGEVEDYQANITKPNVLLVKRITAINGGTTTVGGDNLGQYQDVPTNPYDDNLLDLPAPRPADTKNWPTPNTFLLGGINGGSIKPGDELEYTIYFLSTGEVEAKNVLFCDRVPEDVSYIFNSFGGSSSLGLTGTEAGMQMLWDGVTSNLTNVPDADVGQYFAPGIDPTATYPNINCRGANTNGAVVVNLGNLPNATAPGIPTKSYGFIRFRGRVK